MLGMNLDQYSDIPKLKFFRAYMFSNNVGNIAFDKGAERLEKLAIFVQLLLNPVVRKHPDTTRGLKSSIHL